MRHLPGLLVGVGDLLGRLLLQLMLGEAAPELVQNLSRGRPVFQAQQGRAGVVLRRRADLRRRSNLLDAHEVIGRGAVIPRLVCLLAPLVDGGRQVLHQPGT